MKATPKYEWQQSYLGGGGYITGFLQHPQDPNIFYARCDVAGVFKSENRGRSWRPLNNGMEKSHHHNVRGLAINPKNPKMLLRLSGDARSNIIFGDILKSIDGGDSWYEVCDEIDAYGNGPSRMYQDTIAFSPHNPTIAVAGGYSKGVWLSEDEGESWAYSGLRGERIGLVAFHPQTADCIYVATVSDTVLDVPIDEIESRLQDFPRGEVGKLYRSTDRGDTWEMMWQGYTLTQLAFAVDDPATIFASSKDGRVLKSVDNGRSWTQKSPRVPDNEHMFNTITMSPDGTTLYTVLDARSQPTDRAPIPVFRSTDGAESWELIKWHSVADLRNYPSYMSIFHAGWAISQIIVDWAEPNRLYLSNWYGVAASNDGGETWDGSWFQGMETICGEAILCDPVVKERVYFTMADHAPVVSRDNGQSYIMFAKNKLQGSTALVPSRFRSDLVIYGAVNRSTHVSGIVRTENRGYSVSLVKEFPANHFVQGLAEDVHNQGTFYALIDGELSQEAGIYKSEDWGETWRKLEIEFPAYMKTLPHAQHWIEAELLPVVVWQVKNVCGSNQMLRIDPHNPGVVYMGEWTQGIFRIENDGETVVDISGNLPFGKNKASVLTSIFLDEKRPLHIYAGFIHEGLWRSIDGGKTWTKLFPQSDEVFNVNSLDLGGPTNREIVIASEPLYWSQCESAVYHSTDLGRTWANTFDTEMGAIRWKGIALENSTGTIHGISCGNGCFRAER